MTTLRNGLHIGLLFLAAVIGLQASFLLAQAGGALQGIESSASGVLASTGATLELARSTLAAQQGYYRDSASHLKALTKAAAIDAIELGRLIQHTDARLERITSATENSLDSLRDAASVFAKQTQTIGEESSALLAAGTEATRSAGELARDPSLKQSLANLEASSENLRETTAAAAAATTSIRDMLSPAKKSFWRRLLEMMIPRPTLRIP